MGRIRLENTDERLVNVHDPEKCAGRACAIHNRSEHHLRSWPQHFRGDRGIMERFSGFGCGCPDPDDLDWRADPSSASVHGCIVHPYTGRGVCSKWELDGSRAAFLHPFPGYAVTADGRVWSFRPDNDEDIVWDQHPEELSYTERKGAHPRVTIAIKVGTVQHLVRDLVWMGFRGEKPKGYVVAHDDGDRFNNSVENLGLRSRGAA